MDKAYLQGKKDLTLPEFTCCICGEEVNDYGNNPWPVRTDEDARCCDDCNSKYIIPARIATINSPRERIIEIANNLNTKSLIELNKLFF